MHLEYIRCENSTINNDPFALEYYSAAAIDLENRGIRRLVKFSKNQPRYLVRIVAWLLNSFQKNCFLHTGLNACAQIYAFIMRDRTIPEDLFHIQIKRAEDALDKLTPQSSELSSELNAHIRHVRQHYERLMPQPDSPTFLRVRTGKLVLSLSAACDRTGVQNIFKDDALLRQFQTKVVSTLKELGLEVCIDSFRKTQLMDIFETSFGEAFLKSLTFDIGGSQVNGKPPVQLIFLTNPEAAHSDKSDEEASKTPERSFDFDVRVTLSALGACTVSFEMAIDPDRFPYGLSVEEIRALECCICPHAGQVKLNISRSEERRVSPARFFDRVNIIKLDAAVQNLPGDGHQVFGPTFPNVSKELKTQLAGYLDNSLTESPSVRDARDIELCRAVNSVLELLRGTPHGDDLLDCCHRHNRLSDFAIEILNAVEQAFRGSIVHDVDGEVESLSGDADNTGSSVPEALVIGETISGDEVWHLRPDLGWYAYLNATRIDEVTASLKTINQAVAFDRIQDHSDTRGLVIGQREARTSFDDWRFMSRTVSAKDNLAQVRSHTADAFYASEYQTFLYFPDVQQYLVDQYEETVRLILRLSAGLRFYNLMAEKLTGKLTRQIRGYDELSTSENEILHQLRKIPGLKQILNWMRQFYRDHERMEDLKNHLEKIWRLRVEANELRNLVFKAGISRYQDHGELMRCILDQMNVEAAAMTTDRHLGQLEELSHEIIERLKTSRQKGLSYAGIAVGCLFSAAATKEFVEAGSDFHEHPWTFIFMMIVLCLSLVIGLRLGKPPSEG